MTTTPESPEVLLRKAAEALESFAQLKPHNIPRGISGTVWPDRLRAADSALSAIREYLGRPTRDEREADMKQEFLTRSSGYGKGLRGEGSPRENEAAAEALRNFSKGWQARASLSTQALEAQASDGGMAHPSSVPASDLPGMWESADFMGGQEEVRGPQEREIAWTGADGAHHSMPIEAAEAVLRDLFDRSELMKLAWEVAREPAAPQHAEALEAPPQKPESVHLTSADGKTVPGRTEDDFT